MPDSCQIRHSARAECAEPESAAYQYGISHHRSVSIHCEAKLQVSDCEVVGLRLQNKGALCQKLSILYRPISDEIRVS